MNPNAPASSACPAFPLDFSQTSINPIIGGSSTARLMLRTRPSCAVLLGHDLPGELGTRIRREGSGPVLSSTGDETLLYLVGALGRWHATHPDSAPSPAAMATQLCKPTPAEHAYGHFITHLFAHMERRLPQLFTAEHIRMVALNAARHLLASLADPELSRRALACLDAGRADLLDSMSHAAWLAGT